LAIDLEDLTPDRLKPLHIGRNVTKADVYLLEADGRRYAVKDFRRRPLLVRATIGRWSMRREGRAYDALRELQGVPELEGRPHPLVLVLAYVDGPSLAAWERGRSLPDRFFERLKALLAAVHDRGVVQGDLHHRDVLVGEDGLPWLVDFSTSMVGGPSGGPGRGWLWRLLAANDRRSVLKLQERFEPGTVTESERAEMRERPAIYGIAKRLRGFLRFGR
jgi:hypothetical protein